MTFLRSENYFFYSIILISAYCYPVYSIYVSLTGCAGEVVSAEDLGGADVHCFQSGLTDHYAESEDDALEKARRLCTISLTYF